MNVKKRHVIITFAVNFLFFTGANAAAKQTKKAIVPTMSRDKTSCSQKAAVVCWGCLTCWCPCFAEDPAIKIDECCRKAEEETECWLEEFRKNQGQRLAKNKNSSCKKD